MEILGYFTILIAGVSIGLIGAGGGILTVPILVYLFGINPVIATAYSLFLVGSTSLIGVIPKYLEKNISIKTALLFGFPSIISVFITRTYILPQIPENIFFIGETSVTKSTLLMLIFATLMLFSARSMLKKNKPTTSNSENVNKKSTSFLIPLLGLVEGSITGLVGAGGGFIIIPILTLFAKIDIKKAIGTSLLIVSVKSLIGFSGDIVSDSYTIDWSFLLTIISFSMVGMFIGTFLSKKLDGSKLKSGFGWFILAMGIYILIKELVL